MAKMSFRGKNFILASNSSDITARYKKKISQKDDFKSFFFCLPPPQQNKDEKGRGNKQESILSIYPKLLIIFGFGAK